MTTKTPRRKLLPQMLQYSFFRRWFSYGFILSCLLLNTAAHAQDFTVALPEFNQILSNPADVSDPAPFPTNLTFSDDGLYVYVVGRLVLLQYVLTSPFDITTASFDVSFPVETSAGQVQAASFSNDGLRMFISGFNLVGGGATNADLLQYNLSTAFDIATASIDIAISNVDLRFRGMAFSNDGLVMFGLNARGQNNISQYNLSTAYDMRTISFDNSLDVAGMGQPGFNRSISLSADGTRMFILKEGVVWQYQLTTAFDLSTASFLDQFDSEISTEGIQQETIPGMSFSDDGLRMFLISETSSLIHQYDLTTAYDITTAILNPVRVGNPFSVTVEELFPAGVAFSNNGLQMFVSGFGSGLISQYDLSTAFDVSTSIFNTAFDASAEGTDYAGVNFSTDGLRMFIVDISAADIQQYNLTSAFDLTTATFDNSFDVSTHDGAPAGMTFSDDGLRMFVTGSSGVSVNQYNLTTAFDVTTAAFDMALDVSAESSFFPVGLGFSNDGLRLFVVGNNDNEVNQYNLTTPYNINSASFTIRFDVSGQMTSPAGLAFSPNRQQMFIVGAEDGEVNQYDLAPSFPALVGAVVDNSTQITATFSDNVQTNGGNPNDFTVVDGLGTNFPVSAQADGTAGDTDIVLTVADFSMAVGDLTLTYTNNNNEVSDVATGMLFTETASIMIDADMTAPTLVSAMLDNNTQITLTLSEFVQTNGGNPTDFTVTDGLGTSFAVSAQADGTAEDTDIILTVADVSTATGDLTLTYTNNNNEISDFGSNTLASDATGITIDTDMTAPTLVSAVKDNDSQITLTFSEPVQTNGMNPTDFAVVDGIGTGFPVSAQTDGTAEDTDIILTVTDLAMAVGDLTVTYTNSNNEISDFGGNNLATDATGVSIDTDMTAPTLVSATVDNNTQITVTLSEFVQTNGGNPTDFTVTDALGNDFSVSAQSAANADIALMVADLSTAIGDLTVTYTNNNNEVSDFGGNNLATDGTGVSVDADMAAPTLVSGTRDSDTQITLTFSEPVQTNGTNPTDFTIVDDNSTPFTVSAQVDGTAEDNQIVLTVADLSAAVIRLVITYTNNNNEVSDFGGNNLVTDAVGVEILLDVIPPDVTLSTMANDPNSGAFDIIATFTEDVMGVATSDFTVTNGSATAVTGSGAVYTVTITPEADGAVTVNLPANTVQDLANNDNTASNQISLVNDETAPTVTITSMAVDPVNAPFDISITFSESVTDFDVSDLMVGNGTAGSFSGSGTTYAATITPTMDGLVTVDINVGAGQDVATNGNTAASQFSITNDQSAPTLVISSAVLDHVSGAFNANFNFSEAVTGFDLVDVTVGNGVASAFTGSGSSYSALITPSSDGTVTIDVAGMIAQDAAGNDNIAATQFSIENDETAPTVTITSMAAGPINGAFDITITFSEVVTGFDIIDLSVVNGTAGNFAGSGTTYTATITPTTDGAVTVDILAVAVQDAAGNGNTAATQFSILADFTAPDAPIILGISDDAGEDSMDGVTNDQTLTFNGTAEANSMIEVLIDGSSIGTTTTDGAGAWSFDHSSVSLADGSYSITATATDAAGNTSILSAIFTVSIDTSAPAQPVFGGISDDNGISGTDFITNDRSIIFSGMAEPFSTAGVLFPGGNTRFTTTDASGNWVLDFSNRDFAAGNFPFSVTVTDAAGNTSVVSNVINLIIDTAIPVVSSITRADANPTTASSVDYTVTFSEEVHGLNTSNFELVFTDTQNADIASVSATSGTSVTVTVNNITGSGTFGLNLSNVTGITDVAGNNMTATFTGEVYNTNFFPTDITLSVSSILENNTIGDAIGTLTTADNDTGDTHIYSLVSGAGDTHNASFSISGDQLLAAEAFDLETQASYDIRIQTDDGRGGTFQKAFTITIDNVPEAFLRITGDGNVSGPTPLGITTNFDVMIHNDGDATLNVNSILYSDPVFSGPAGGITIAPMGNQVVTLGFTPPAAQTYTADITFNTNGGTGVLSVSADGAIITSVDNGQLKAEVIKLYPNPANDLVTIDLSDYNGRSLDIQMFNLSGIKTFEVNQYQQSQLRLNVSGYQNGLYLMQFSDGKNVVQKKVMIRK